MGTDTDGIIPISVLVPIVRSNFGYEICNVYTYLFTTDAIFSLLSVPIRVIRGSRDLVV